VITPGTEFMKNLSNAIHNYIQKRIADNYPYLKGLKVIFSDWTVPGEGEHKILEFLRL
jgi:5'-3' exonuclease